MTSKKNIYIYNNDVPKHIFQVTFNNRNSNSKNSNMFSFLYIKLPQK